MTTPATLLSALIIAAHDGNNAAFAAKHRLSPQYIGQVVNRRGQSTVSFARLNQLAEADGYTIGTVLQPYTGDMVADALAHVRAAAIEARRILEYQDELTPEQREQLALLDKIIDAL
jgi:hypothetical protein